VKKKAATRKSATTSPSKRKATTKKPVEGATSQAAESASPPTRKKRAKKKPTVRKKPARTTAVAQAESVTESTAETTYDPRQMTLFDAPDQPSPTRDKAQKLEAEAAPAETIKTSRVAGVERSEPPELERPEDASLGAHSVRPQPPVTEPQPAPAKESNTAEAPPQATAAKPSSTVSSVVSYLEREGVLRSRIDLDTDQPVVQLYHDYLSRAVAEAERRADRWPTVLREAQQQFDEAGSSLLRRWRAMLPPWQQLRLLIERLRPSINFKYGPDKKFATFSLLRFVPHLIVLLSFLLGWQEWERHEQHLRDRATAKDLMTIIAGSDDYPTIDDFKALEDLADSSEGVRLAVIDQMLENEVIARSLEKRYDYIAHAVVGLDVAMRDRIRDRLVERGKEPSDIPAAICVATARLGIALSIPENTDLNQLIAESFVAAMKETTEPYTLSTLGRALGALGDQLDATSAAAGAELIVALIKETTNPFELSSLGSALGALDDQLDATSAAAGAELIVAAMKETTDPTALSSLGRALGSLGEHLDATSASAGAEQIVAAMKETTDRSALSPLSRALASLAKRLEPRDVVGLLKSVVCVGETRKRVFNAITERPDWESESDGNLWTIVKWAEGQGVDVEKTPRWPLAP